MKTILLAAGVAAAVLAAGSALAASKMGAAVAPPKQPIPYDQLNAYLKASPSQRAHKDWWSGQMASTGTPANTSAAAPASPPSPALPNDTPPATTDATPAPANMPSPENLEEKKGPPPAMPMDRPH